MHIRLLVLVVGVFLLAGCKDVIEGTTIERTRGTVLGTVKELNDSTGYPINSAGAVITSNISPDTAVTDANGTYKFSLPTGTHILTISKTGYGEIKVFNVIVPGPGIASPIVSNSLAKKPLGFFVIDSFGQSLQSVSGHSIQPQGQEYARAASMISLYHTLEDAQRDTNSIDYVILDHRSNSNKGITFYQAKDLYGNYSYYGLSDIYSHGFAWGKDLYARVRDLEVDESSGSGMYYDLIQEKTIYSAAGPLGPIFHHVLP